MNASDISDPLSLPLQHQFPNRPVIFSHVIIPIPLTSSEQIPIPINHQVTIRKFPSPHSTVEVIAETNQHSLVASRVDLEHGAESSPSLEQATFQGCAVEIALAVQHQSAIRSLAILLSFLHPFSIFAQEPLDIVHLSDYMGQIQLRPSPLRIRRLGGGGSIINYPAHWSPIPLDNTAL